MEKLYVRKGYRSKNKKKKIDVDRKTKTRVRGLCEKFRARARKKVNDLRARAVFIVGRDGKIFIFQGTMIRFPRDKTTIRLHYIYVYMYFFCFFVFFFQLTSDVIGPRRLSRAHATFFSSCTRNQSASTSGRFTRDTRALSYVRLNT